MPKVGKKKFAYTKKGKAKAPGTLWPRVLDADFEEVDDELKDKSA